MCSCAQPAMTLRGIVDPLGARVRTIGGVDGGECDQNFVVTWPSDVERLKVRVGAMYEATDLGVKECTGLSESERATWQSMIAGWREFAAKPVPWFGSYNEWVTACSHARTLDGYREKLAKMCTLPGPDHVKGWTDSVDTSAFKWIAAAVIAVAVVGGGVYVARQVL